MKKSILLLLSAFMVLNVAFAQEMTEEQLDKYRKAIEESDPSGFIISDGEELWKKPAGPNNVSLEQCDLGKGPGVLEGAYTELPRYFADVDRVMDAEARIVHCKMELQGMSFEEATNKWKSSGSDQEVLTAYIASKSVGKEIDIPMNHEKERISYLVGEKLFYARSGPQDFGCVTCHAVDNARIRLTVLPNLTTNEGAGDSLKTWPAYRISKQTIWTMQVRLIDCIRQMRWPEPDYGSDAIVALQSYLMRNAKGTPLKPGIKR